MKAQDEEVTIAGRPSSIKTGGASVCVIVLTGNSIGKMFKLVKPYYVIGRAADADIRLEDEGVSRRHAKLTVQGSGVVVLSDNGSTNGTFVNGERISQHALSDGDRVQIGSTTILKFSVQDALEQSFQEHLYTAVTRDALTNAYNKRFFVEQLIKDFAHCKRHGTPLSLLAMDLDYFKHINDSYGHLAGDEVLRQLVKLVGDSIRVEDVLCRTGGEEFTLIARSSGSEGAHQLADRLRAGVERHLFTFESNRLPVTVSIGVSSYDAAVHQTPEQLIQEADRKLYVAKRSGRNCVR